MKNIRNIIPLFFLLIPLFLLFVAPLGYMIYYSFTEREIIGSVEFIGLKNYFSLIVTPEFWSSLKFSFNWAIVTVILQTFFGLVLSIMLNETSKLKKGVRVGIFMPYIIMMPVVAIAFIFLFGGSFGLIKILLKPLLGIGSWFDQTYAPVTVTIAAVWRFTPFSMIVFLSGLQAIPSALYAAAKVDGASRLGRFRHVTLPGLRDATFVVLLLRFIWMFNTFDIIWLLTRGGPLRVTQNLSIYAYRQAFEYFNFGTACALGVIVFLITSLIVYIHFNVHKKISGDTT